MGTRFKGDTKDPAVNVTTWVLLVTIIFSVSARLATKIRLFKRLTTDDLLIIASLVLAIGQSIVVSLAVGSGYGKHSKDVSSTDMEQVMKNLFAASLLYLLSLTFSKLSLVVFIRGLTPSAKDKWLARGVEVIVYGWAVVTIFGTAFQCSLPRTWDFQNGRCFNLLAWRYFVAISNIVTDLLIVTQAMILVSSIQTTLGRRLVLQVSSCLGSCEYPGSTEWSPYSSELQTHPISLDSVTVATIVELAFIKKATNTHDSMFQMCEITIFEVLIQCLSIVTACWGQLNPFLSWMRSNGLKLDGVEDPTSWSYKMRSQSQVQSKSRDHKVKFESHQNFAFPVREDQILVTQDWEVDSQSSQAHIMGDSGTHQ